MILKRWYISKMTNQELISVIRDLVNELDPKTFSLTRELLTEATKRLEAIGDKQ